MRMENKHGEPEKRCILLVDDDFINREVVKNIFSSEYTFEEAENGREGLRKLEQHSCKLAAILADVTMPEMDGLEMLRILRQRGIPERIPVFLITSNDELSITRAAYELGVMDVILKPVTPFVVQRRVQSVIELFHAREALSATVQGQQQKLRENADTIDALHRTTIQALASAIEFRDMESGEHTNRIYEVTKYLLSNTAMGEGFTAEEIENMAVGSIMHDIGKIAISDVILNKPGKLTAREYEIMKQHTIKGAVLLENLAKTQEHPAYRYAVDIARHHHERWDGNGYPDGLKGDQITPWAQVVSIADVYDALVSPRVYKKAFSADKAVEMICGGQCGVFAPKLLACFRQVEPQIRMWYADTAGKDALKGPGRADQTEKKILEPSKELIDVLLLTAAVQSAYDMIISANLTQNSFHMIDYDRFQTQRAERDGTFDDLIAAGLSSVPEQQRRSFSDSFSRQSLMRAYAQGKKSVRLEHSQYADDGRLLHVETSVLLMEDPRTGDLCEITLSRYIN